MYTDYRTATAIQSRRISELRRSAAQHRSIEKDEGPEIVVPARRFSLRALLALVKPRHA
ncbi:MAG: hypothetical protein R3343_00855 [Nitriliruptorales bacterium]|nr:hypothetical protein [Nitriliruptorales bacterium]